MTLNEARKFADVVTAVYQLDSQAAAKMAKEMNLHFSKYVWWAQDTNGTWTLAVDQRRRRPVKEPIHGQVDKS